MLNYFVFQNFNSKKKKLTSNASRNIKKFYFRFKLQPSSANKQIKPLIAQPVSKAGRGFLGISILRTRGRLIKKKRSMSVNYNLRYLKLGFIANFKFVTFKNKLLSLVFFSNGAFCFFLATQIRDLFSFWFLNQAKRTRKLKLFKNLLIFNALCRIKKLSFVSVLELLPGRNAQYVRSPGTKAKLIKLDKDTHTALLQLPSKIKKIFSFYAFALYGQLALPDAKRLTNSKAGYWRSMGHKSVVRGVAMNAVDHPHGGRTKTVKTPLTPWGKPTKRK